MVLADLLSVPNQPLTFAGESFSRSEDSIIAYSWRKYLETGDPTWPVNLPMTRAAMRAMDAVTDFMGAPVGGNVDIESFVVSGASKRGWTTWLASATDPRVSYAIPVVADLLNMETSFVHHYAYYNGTFSVAVRDYVNEGILNIDNFGKDGINSLLSIVDPFTYKDRLTLPKYIINASGDEFFVPDSWKFYYDQLPGPKAIRYIPNTGHGISDPTVLIDAFTLLVGVSFGYQIPEYSFTQLPDGTIELQTSSPVVDARLFQATNPNAREFRFAAVGGIFTSTNLVDQGGGVYRANVPTPAQGWTAYLIQVSFPIPTGGWATVSSGVYFKGPPVNQQPIISPTPDITVGEGSFSIPVIATDPDQGQTLTYSLDPGAPAGVSINPTTGVITGFSNDQLGLLAPVTVVVSDNGSPVVRFRDSFRITVVNANPTAGLVGASSAVRGEVVPFTFSATDPSPIDQASNFTYEIDWDGDGLVDVTQVAGASLNLTHAFANTGSYTVRARVTDKDGGSSVWATQPVAVTRSRTAPNPLNSSLTDLFIGGLATDDFIIAGNAQNIDPLLPAGSIFYFNGNALSEGLETFTGITGQVVVYLQGGDDIFNPTDISVGTKQFGGSGNDVLFGSIASDTLDGGDGDDVLVGSLDPSTVGDLLLGGANADVILAADGNDTINGGSGEDLILGGDGNNVIDGGADNDVVIGGAGNDSLLGSQGSDFIVGGLGADTIFGGTGQDLIIAGVIDPNQELSETVLFEWWSAGTYTNRVNHLLGNQPGGLNSQNLTPGDNVLDDLSADQVFGEADEDFFFVSLALDATPDLVVGEIRAPL
jgi:Ca2+-binding RTX toxin-like protein